MWLKQNVPKLQEIGFLYYLKNSALKLAEIDLQTKLGMGNIHYCKL